MTTETQKIKINFSILNITSIVNIMKMEDFLSISQVDTHMIGIVYLFSIGNLDLTIKYFDTSN